MSDFLFARGHGAGEPLAHHLDARLRETGATVTERSGSWGRLAIARAPHDPAGVVQEDERHLAVLCATPPASLSDPSGPDADALPDGPHALIRIDKLRGDVRVITDRMSFIPVFARTDGSVIGTHVDAVAHAAGSHTLDLASAVDMLAHGSMCHPHTLYRHVRALEPASVTEWTGTDAAPRVRPYWEPLERRLFGSLREAATALRRAVSDSVRSTVGEATQVGVLFSAGEDSRTVLGCVPPGLQVSAYTLAERENREVRLARRAAEAYGARPVLGRRQPGHYLIHFDPMCAIAGSHARFLDVHTFGLHETLGLGALPLVLGGFSADALLKLQYARGSVYEPPALAGVRQSLAQEVADRRRRHRARVNALRPDSADEWAKIWPSGMRNTMGNLHGGRRLFRLHEPFMCDAVVEIAAATPQPWKRHRRLFLRAFRPMLAPSWYVPHVRSRFPWFGPVPNLALGLALNLGRGVHDRVRGLRRAQEGWTEPVDMVAHPAMQSLWQRLRDGSPVFDLFEDAQPPSVMRIASGWSPRRRLLLLQLSRLAEPLTGAPAAR